MQRQLAAIFDEFQHAQSRLELLAEAVPDEGWVLRTDPARWSAGECIPAFVILPRHQERHLDQAVAAK